VERRYDPSRERTANYSCTDLDSQLPDASAARTITRASGDSVSADALHRAALAEIEGLSAWTPRARRSRANYSSWKSNWVFSSSIETPGGSA